MKFKELKSQNKENLEKKKNEARIELIKLYSQVATGSSIKNPSQIKQLRKTIAKINTLQFERQEEQNE